MEPLSLEDLYIFRCWWKKHGQQKKDWVVATQIFFSFIPILGEMIQIDEHIFQLGWNHQLEEIPLSCSLRSA